MNDHDKEENKIRPPILANEATPDEFRSLSYPAFANKANGHERHGNETLTYSFENEPVPEECRSFAHSQAMRSVATANRTCDHDEPKNEILVPHLNLERYLSENEVNNLQSGHGDVSEVDINPKLRQAVILFVRSSADGITIQDITKSVKGFIQSCRDSLGRRCSLMQVIKKQFACELFVTTGRYKRIYINEAYQAIEDKTRFHVKQSFYDTYYQGMKAKAEAIAVKKLTFSQELRENILCYVDRGDASMNDMVENVKGLWIKCLDIAGQVSAQRFNDIMKIHFSDNIETEIITVCRRKRKVEGNNHHAQKKRRNK